MGNKPSKGQRLGGPEPQQVGKHSKSPSKSSFKGFKKDSAPAPAPAPKAPKGGNTLKGPGDGASAPDPRQAAAEAAERRMKAEQQRGTNASNPNAGRLAAKVGKAPAKMTPGREEERLVWD